MMGNREGVLFVYMLNCTLCILFLIMGILMFNASRPTLQMVSYLKIGIQNVPDKLKKHAQIDQFLI